LFASGPNFGRNATRSKQFIDPVSAKIRGPLGRGHFRHGEQPRRDKPIAPGRVDPTLGAEVGDSIRFFLAFFSRPDGTGDCLRVGWHAGPSLGQRSVVGSRTCEQPQHLGVGTGWYSDPGAKTRTVFCHIAVSMLGPRWGGENPEVLVSPASTQPKLAGRQTRKTPSSLE